MIIIAMGEHLLKVTSLPGVIVTLLPPVLPHPPPFYLTRDSVNRSTTSFQLAAGDEIGVSPLPFYPVSSGWQNSWDEWVLACLSRLFINGAEFISQGIL